MAAPASNAASATPKSESADGSGVVTTPTVEVAAPPVMNRSCVLELQSALSQVPSPPPPSAPVVRVSVTVPPEFTKSKSKSSINTGPVRSGPGAPSNNPVEEEPKITPPLRSPVYVAPANPDPDVVTISMLLNVFVAKSYLNDPVAVPPVVPFGTPVVGSRPANVTPVNVQRTESAEAMLGSDNKT